MDRSGINPDIYKPHSTRAAVISKAAKTNVPCYGRNPTSGGVVNSGTFGKFYHKEVYSEGQFDKIVMLN